ncbi:FHA domain-containing protein [Candidatus Viridilinea mediisalina]|uniref:Forkhead-associated protein n=1 Tax=Candidatus Viridilinea mediisalina TaxID=2024553 RepID=A0A2A6RIF8_9CHLR|nr:FHA domain-containing protein [Candidatus Viridilinea mediisalina]PDW02669.1 forkhead-associated protein [Candidatus Viridilinea mediisalina]
MQQCSHCNAQQLDGAIFCSECGASLLAAPTRRGTTASLNKAASPSGLVEKLEPNVIEAPVPVVAPNISLVVLNSGRRIELEGGQDLVVGRKDNQRGIFPDVDLGLDGGYDAGVSRRHAIITPHNAGYVLEDLASANGTFVNGRRLKPQKPVAINHGDEIKFGTLILRFEIA